VLLDVSVAEGRSSFGFLAAFRRPSLRAGGNLVVWRAVLMLAVLAMLPVLPMLEVLVVVVEVPIRLVVPMLLRSKLVHLLRARSELVRAAISSHRHYSLSV
jgi:hypothetical protein